MGKLGSLHAGVMMGRDLKTDRKTRITFVLLLFFWEGWTREMEERGGGGGGGAAVGDAGSSLESSSLDSLGFPISGT